MGLCTLFLACQLAAQAPAPAWDDICYKRPAFAHGWKYIVIHNSATSSGNATSFGAYHTQMGYGGLAYHFVIGNGRGSRDGQVEEGFRWKQQMSGTHVTVNAWYHNIYGIGICLVGDLERTRPTKKQRHVLKASISTMSSDMPRTALAFALAKPRTSVNYDAVYPTDEDW